VGLGAFDRSPSSPRTRGKSRSPRGAAHYPRRVAPAMGIRNDRRRQTACGHPCCTRRSYPGWGLTTKSPPHVGPCRDAPIGARGTLIARGARSGWPVDLGAFAGARGARRPCQRGESWPGRRAVPAQSGAFARRRLFTAIRSMAIQSILTSPSPTGRRTARTGVQGTYTSNLRCRQLYCTGTG